MFAGEVRQQGAIADVFARPADPEVAAFLGIENILHGSVLTWADGLARIRVGDGELLVATDLICGELTLVLDASDVTLIAGTPEVRTSARNALHCKVTAVEAAGRRVSVRLDAGFPLVAVVTRAAADDLDLAPGACVTASIKATAAHLIPR
jgi:molybdate transport system ATP-binding protein